MTRNSKNRPPTAGRHLSISDLPVKNLEAVEASWRASLNESEPCAHGAELTFLGVVRGTEDGAPITGIDYSGYQDLAVAELTRIGDEGDARFGSHPLFIHHSLGFVAQGEASVIIRLQLPHSAEAFEASQWYLAAIKTRVPIWKRAICS